MTTPDISPSTKIPVFLSSTHPINPSNTTEPQSEVPQNTAPIKPSEITLHFSKRTVTITPFKMRCQELESYIKSQAPLTEDQKRLAADYFVKLMPVFDSDKVSEEEKQGVCKAIAGFCQLIQKYGQVDFFLSTDQEMSAYAKLLVFCIWMRGEALFRDMRDKLIELPQFSNLRSDDLKELCLVALTTRPLYNINRAEFIDWSSRLGTTISPDFLIRIITHPRFLELTAESLTSIFEAIARLTHLFLKHTNIIDPLISHPNALLIESSSALRFILQYALSYQKNEVVTALSQKAAFDSIEEKDIANIASDAIEKDCKSLFDRCMRQPHFLQLENFDLAHLISVSTQKDDSSFFLQMTAHPHFNTLRDLDDAFAYCIHKRLSEKAIFLLQRHSNSASRREGVISVEVLNETFQISAQRQDLEMMNIMVQADVDHRIHRGSYWYAFGVALARCNQNILRLVSRHLI